MDTNLQSERYKLTERYKRKLHNEQTQPASLQLSDDGTELRGRRRPGPGDSDFGLWAGQPPDDKRAGRPLRLFRTFEGHFKQ